MAGSTISQRLREDMAPGQRAGMMLRGALLSSKHHQTPKSRFDFLSWAARYGWSTRRCFRVVSAQRLVNAVVLSPAETK